MGAVICLGVDTPYLLIHVFFLMKVHSNFWLLLLLFCRGLTKNKVGAVLALLASRIEEGNVRLSQQIDRQTEERNVQNEHFLKLVEKVADKLDQVGDKLNRVGDKLDQIGTNNVALNRLIERTSDETGDKLDEIKRATAKGNFPKLILK